MTRGRTVEVSVEPGAGNGRLVGAALASLPLSFRIAADGGVLALSGRGDWPDRAVAAIEAGAEGVFVTEPDPASAAAIERLRNTAIESSTPVRLGREWLDDPAVDAVRQAQAGSADVGVLADSHAVIPPGESLPGVLAAQLGVLARAFAASARVEDIAITSAGYSAAGVLRRGGAAEPLLVSAVRSTACSARIAVRRLTRTGRTHLQLFGAASARPALATLGDENAERLLPTIYETGYRAAWRALHEDLRHGRVDTAPLGEFAAACAEADRVIAERATTAPTASS